MPITFLTNEDENRYVKSINGATPDPETGDVVIPIPESPNDSVDYVTGKTESTKQEIVLDDSIWHYGQIYIHQDTIDPSEAYMYTDKIKLNETKTFSFIGSNQSGVKYHIPIRRIVAYDVNGNRLAEHSVNTETTGGSISSMPTRPITMHSFVDSIVLMVYKPFGYTNKIITLDGDDGEDAYCQFAPMRVISSYDIPVLSLNGDCNGMTKNVSKNLQFTFQGMSGVAEVKLQGSSSVNTGKQIGGAFDSDVGGLYNFTIKFPEAFEAREGWGAQTKYCFKANAIDHSQARNVCSCKLWGQIVKSRANVPAELSSLPNGGAIDGFPIVISINGKYYALGTLNIPKDGWMFGSPKAIVCADTHCDATKFKALATLDGDFELEYVEAEENADWVLTSLNTAIQAVMDSDGTDIDTVIGRYIDISSAIDYYIHTVEESANDGTSKNYLLVTFDGTKWYFSAYDRDTTYGLYWTGETIDYQKDGINFVRYAEIHKLMDLIYNYKKADLKNRAIALRNNVKSEFNVANVFTKFVGGIPAAIYEQNIKRWPLLRSTSISNVEQILNWYRMRRAYIDKLIDAM